ncbi:MAG: ChbG/HpnK family deacetylase [Oscillospiraceae bacterium]|nr:ChbG/HpnK family deacetylase [Oscillospiraceae bacterium]
MPRRILIRADDLGWTEAINYGIAKTMRDGIIRTVGLMPNMPAAQHGWDLVKDLGPCVGQHTNICVGRPLTDPALIPSICQGDGSLKSSRTYREAAQRGEDFVVLDEVVREIEAQYHRFLEITGQQPHYFEGHAVASSNFFKGLAVVAERHGLPLLPFSMAEPVRFRSSLLTISLDSMQPDYDPFESLKAVALRDYGPDGCCMFVCHPGYLDDELLSTSSLTTPRTKEVAMAIDPAVRQWLADNQVEVITYDDL